jgi:hypothetical protein
MTNRINLLGRNVVLASVALGALIMIGFQGSAMAASATGTITQAEINAASASSPQLLVQLNSVNTVNYTTQQTSPGCGIPNYSIDVIKVLQSQAQAALLAGKNVVIYYTACAGIDYVYDIVLQK